MNLQAKLLFRETMSRLTECAEKLGWWRKAWFTWKAFWSNESLLLRTVVLEDNFAEQCCWAGCCRENIDTVLTNHIHPKIWDSVQGVRLSHARNHSGPTFFLEILMLSNQMYVHFDFFIIVSTGQLHSVRRATEEEVVEDFLLIICMCRRQELVICCYTSSPPWISILVCIRRSFLLQ